jgi:hypothetical protein
MSLIEIKKSLTVMITPGDVVELRIFEQYDKKICGWFNDINKMAEAAFSHDDTAEGIYYTCNACVPDMLAIANNRIVSCKTASSEKNMIRRRIIGIDIDPERNPKKISSTDEEHKLSIERAIEIRAWLKSQGWSDPVLGDSGNGAHLDYFVDLPITEEVKGIYKRFFAVLKAKFSDKKVDVQGFEDANRVWKLYGTTARKGENLPNRPHRKSSILEIPAERKLITLDQMLKIAGGVVIDAEKPHVQNDKAWNPDKLESWLKEHNAVIERVKKEGNITRFVLKTCLNNPEHEGHKEAEVHINEVGIIGYKCHHDSCKGVTWVQVREKNDPEYKKKKEAEKTNPTPNNNSNINNNDAEAHTLSKTKEMALKDIILLNKEEHERKLEVQLPEDHFITRCVKWLNSINDGYQEYKIISAFWILSALVRNKIILKLKQGVVKPNLWMCVLGKSTTSRKSTVVNACRGVYEVATEDILYNDDYSIEGYLETLSLNPVLHNVRDEVAGLMAKFHKKYNEGIFELECAVYDCQNIKKTLSGGKAKSPRTFVVNDPYVTKLYATTPDNFSRYMTVDDFTCGYGYRFLFAHPKYNREKMPLEMEEEEDITAWAGVLADIKKIHRYFSETVETSFKVDPEAMKYYNNVLKQMETRAEESNNDFLGAAIGRNQGHILKLALLIEIGGKVNSHTVSYDSMVLACDMVTGYFLPEILDVIDRLQDDVKIYQVEKVSTTLRRKGGVMTHSQLLHDTKLKSKEFVECISTLIESKTIEPIKEEKSKIVYYRMLNHNNSKNLSIPKIPPILLFSQGNDTRENLENSNKLEKLDDTHAHARALGWYGSRVVFVKESENLGNSGNSENRQSTSGENSPDSPLCPCGYPESYHYDDGCMGDGASCTCKQYGQTPAHQEEKAENPCYLCGKTLNTSESTVNYGAGMGDVHESCIKNQNKAARLLKENYDNYRPPNSEDIAHRIEGMNGYLSGKIEGISTEAVNLAIGRYCKERGWKT